MPYALALLLVAAESFLLGSIPCGVLVGRLAYGEDPREGGSGSIGMTNMARLFGARAAAVTFAGDVVKGVAAVGVARLLLAFVPIGAVAAWQADLVLALSIVCGIAGHVFCPWLGFRGGKGISTGLGTIGMAYPPVVALMLGSFLVVAFASRRVSAGSIVAACMFPVAACIFEWGNVPLFIVALAVAVFVTWAHRANIVRMLHGEEPKFSLHKGGGDAGGDGTGAGEDGAPGDARAGAVDAGGEARGDTGDGGVCGAYGEAGGSRACADAADGEEGGR